MVLVVEPVVVGALLSAVAVNATTCSAEGASRRPSPTLGVGKWLAGTPMDACCWTDPVVGSSPYSTPSCPMVQTNPAATIGGPPPTSALQRTLSAAATR